MDGHKKIGKRSKILYKCALLVFFFSGRVVIQRRKKTRIVVTPSKNRFSYFFYSCGLFEYNRHTYFGFFLFGKYFNGSILQCVPISKSIQTIDWRTYVLRS